MSTASTNTNASNENTHGKQNTNPQYFFKTKMCPFMLMGKCGKGFDCTFAHTEQELQKQPDLKKTKLCELYMHGQCPNGSQCSFAHGKGELRSPPDFYKTSLCLPYMNGKVCFYGDKCRFAHGVSELRPKQRINTTQHPQQTKSAEKKSIYHSANLTQTPSLTENKNEASGTSTIGSKLSKALQFISLEEKLRQNNECYSLSTQYDSSNSNFDNFFVFNPMRSKEKYFSDIQKMSLPVSNFSHFSLEGMLKCSS